MCLLLIATNAVKLMNTTDINFQQPLFAVIIIIIIVIIDVPSKNKL
jgi:hypothetical protein